MFFDKKASIQRLTKVVGNSNKGTFQAISGMQSLNINVQPANPDTTVLVGGVFGKTYNIFTTASGIKEGDKLTVSGTFIDNASQNKTLNVTSVGNWYFGVIPHFEIICTELK